MLIKNRSLQTGISFIEVLVSLLLFSILMSFAIPRFLNTQQGRTKKLFFSEFSTLVANTVHQAIMTKKIHQIFWDINKQEIAVKIFDETSESQNKHAQFKPADASIFKTQMKIPDSFIFHNFFINGADSMGQDAKLKTVFTYIMPDGTSQAVIINIQDENETNKNRFSIVINPFFSRVSLHDIFQKP